MRPLLRLAVVLLSGIAVAAQDGTLPVPANVKAEGLPPISTAVVEKLKPYASFATTRMLAWHPSKPEMIVATTNGPVASHLHAVAKPGAAPVAIGQAPRASNASFGPLTSDFLIYQSDNDGNERSQIYRFDFATQQATLLTDGKSANRPPSWANGSNRIAFTSTRRNNVDWDLYVTDVTKPESVRLLTELKGSWSVADWSPDDKHLLLLESLPGLNSALWTYDLETGARTALTGDGAPARWLFAQYAPDGKSVYAVSNRDAELPRVWRGEGVKWTPLTKEGDAVEGVTVSPDGLTMAVVFDRHASSRLELIDVKTMKVRFAPALPAGTIGSVQRWSPSGAEFAVTLNTLTTNGDVFSVNAKTGAVTRWTTSSVGGVDASTLPHPEIVSWKTFDGRMIPGVLYRPPAKKFSGPRPVMIFFHGGPDAYERPRFLGRSAYFLNELGVVLIYPNVRGSTGAGRSYQILDDGRKREDAVKDAGALLDWIATQKAFDAKRVMVTGASYGGYMSLATAYTYPDRIRGAFLGSAIADFVTFLETTEPQRAADRRAEYGDERDPEMRKFLLSVSPVAHAAKIKVPLAIVHGKNDPRVPVGQAQAMYDAARANNVAAWMIVFDDEGHEITKRANADYYFYPWITFVEKFLVN